MKISLVHPNPNNPRLIKDERFKKLCQSIKEFPKMMALRPIIVDKDGMILGGNMRFKALKELGYKDIPDEWVKRDSELTEAEKRRFIVADNIGFGEYDWDVLANEWDKDQLIDWGLEIPDFAFKQEATEDDYEIPDEIKTDIVLGDLFEIGQHRLMCGDSTDSDAVARLMNGNKADMVFTDPPYGVSVVDKNGQVGGENLCEVGIYKPIIGDDTIETARKFYQCCLSLGFDKYIIWGGNYFTSFLPPTPCWIIWDKRGDMNSNNFADGEIAWTSFDSPVRIKKQVWAGMIKEGEHEKRLHPTQKPVKLCSELLSDYCKGKNVFDGFGGSGSIMVACHHVKKRSFMIELSPDYCQVIIDRMRKLDPEIIIKKNGKLWEGQ